MIRGAILGVTAIGCTVGALTYQAGAFTPEALVGPSAAASYASANAAKGHTVDGDVVATRFGNVQVQLVVSGTKIEGVNILQAPSGRNQSWSNYALPKLIAATLSAQSAEISSISGASYTSGGYIQSLQSALNNL